MWRRGASHRKCERKCKDITPAIRGRPQPSAPFFCDGSCGRQVSLSLVSDRDSYRRAPTWLLQSWAAPRAPAGLAGSCAPPLPCSASAVRFGDGKSGGFEHFSGSRARWSTSRSAPKNRDVCSSIPAGAALSRQSPRGRLT